MAKIITGGTYGEGKEVLTYPRYDRVKLLSTTLKHILFDKKIGDARAAVALTRADTNMEEGGKIPNVMKWEIQEIWFFYQAIALRNNAELQLIRDMIRQTVMEIEILSKFKVFDISLSLFDGTMQIVNVPTVAGDNIPPGSYPSYTGKLVLEVPIILESQTTFKLSLEHVTAPGAGLDGDYIGFVWWIKQFIGPPVNRAIG